MPEEVKTGELVSAAQSTALTTEAAPDFITRGDARGVTDIANEDVQMPRLGLAQNMSPEVQEVDSKYITGLKVGDMFNNLSKQIYGRGPIKFQIVRADPPRYVEFNPLDQGGGIKDINVSPDDPRAKFGPNGEKPVATKFYDFVIMLVPSREFIVLSCKSSNLKVARELNGLVKMRGAYPLFAGVYELTAKQTKNSKGTFFVFNIKNAGWASDKETYLYAEAAFEALKTIKTINVQREDAPEAGDDDFKYGENNPSAPDGEVVGSM